MLRRLQTTDPNAEGYTWVPEWLSLVPADWTHYLFLRRRTLRWFPFPNYCKQGSRNMSEQVSVGYDIRCFGHVPSNGLYGSYGRFMFSHWEFSTVNSIATSCISGHQYWFLILSIINNIVINMAVLWSPWKTPVFKAKFHVMVHKCHILRVYPHIKGHNVPHHAHYTVAIDLSA